MVAVDGARVEAGLSARVWLCPVVGCGGRLGPWGWARARRVFLDLEERGGGTWVRPRRARCGSCGVSQVLLDRRMLSRRKDGLAVIQAGLELAAGGMGVGRVAWEVGRPFSTVRGWLRSAGDCAGGVEGFLAGLGQVVGGALPAPVGVLGVARLVSACVRYAAGTGWPVSDWLVAGASGCRCRLLQRSWWVQHETAVAGLGWPLALSGAGP